jgi:hypothetical protein
VPSAPGLDDTDGEANTGPSFGWAKFGESLTLKGLRVSATTTVLFEVYMSKPGVAGLPTQEVLVAWAVAPVLVNGQVRTSRGVDVALSLPLRSSGIALCYCVIGYLLMLDC